MGGSGTALLGPLPLAGGLPPNAAFASSSAKRRSVSCARAGAPSGLPSSPEKPAQQLENAKDDAGFFAGIRDMRQGTVDEHKSLATTEIPIFIHQDIALTTKAGHPGVSQEILTQTGTAKAFNIPGSWPTGPAGARYDLVFVFDRPSGSGPITGLALLRPLIRGAGHAAPQVRC
jgi:hypothetical protein